MLIKLLAMVTMPLIKLSLIAAEDSEYNLVFKFLIIGSNKLCSPCDKPDVEQRILEHLLNIANVFA